MRKFLVILAVLLLAGAANAGTYPYVGSIAFGLGTLPGATGTGVGTYTNAGTSPHITTIPIPVMGPITLSIPVTADSTIQSVRLTGVGNASAPIGPVSGGPPLTSNTMGLTGLAKICLFFDAATCSYGPVIVPLSPTASTGMGIGGVQTATGAVNITMNHAPWVMSAWTAMTIHDPASVVTTPTLPAGFVTPASATATPSGMLQLVTVSKVFTSLTTSFPELPVYAIMNLHFVPEPGTLLLLGSGVVGLAMLGRKRQR